MLKMDYRGGLGTGLLSHLHWHHWVHEKIEGGLIELEYIPMADQVANIFMKPLMAEKFWRFHGALGLVLVKSH